MPLYRKFYLVVVVVVCAAFSLFTQIDSSVWFFCLSRFAMPAAFSLFSAAFLLFTQIDSRVWFFSFFDCAIPKHHNLTQTVCET